MRVLEPLLAKADVLVENFRPGTMERLGLGYEQLAARFPRLVYCSISGFGQTGPRREEPGYDAVIQAEGGLMSITGCRRRRSPSGSASPSPTSSAACSRRRASPSRCSRASAPGADSVVDIGMLDATAALLTYQAGIYFATGTTPGRMGNRHPTIVPYETFAAADGDFVVAVGNDDQWRRFCSVLELDALAADERFATNRLRLANYDALRPLLGERLRSRTRTEWVDGSEEGRRAVRFGARRRRGAPGSAARCARDDPASRARRRRRDARHRRPDQAVGHAGRGADARRRRSASTPSHPRGGRRAVSPHEIDELRGAGAI